MVLLYCFFVIHNIYMIIFFCFVQELEEIFAHHKMRDQMFLVRKSGSRDNLHILVLCYAKKIYNYVINSYVST